MINKYLIYLFPVSILVLVLHLIAIQNDYYWILWWYDIPMHILGGAVIVALYMWLAQALSVLPRLYSYFRVLILILIIGISWEVWELMYDLTFVSDDGYVVDITHDIINDIIGAMFMYWCINRFSINKLHE